MDSPRTIKRSRDDRVVFGVCGGVARALDVDPTIVRIATVVLVAVGGVGLVAYVVAALLLPEEGGKPILDLGVRQHDRASTILGLLLIAVVVLLLAGDWWPGPHRGGVVVLGVVALGVWLLVRDRRRAGDEGTVAVGAGATGAGASGATATVERPATAVTTETPAAPARPADTRPLPPVGVPPSAPPAPETRLHGARTRRRRRATGVAWGVTLLALAAGAVVLQAAMDDPAWDVYAAAAVAVVGLVAVLAAPFGGAPSLVVCGLLLAAGVGVAAASDVDFDAGAGERVYRPASVSQLRDAYELGAGSMTLDLSGLRLPPGTTTVEADVGFGEILVDVPPDADVEVEASANAGDVVAFGETDDGFGVDTTRSSEGSGSARLVLDAHVGFGHIEVERGQR